MKPRRIKPPGLFMWENSGIEVTDNNRWNRESKKSLELHPLCEECLRHDIAAPATVVAHMTAYTFSRMRPLALVKTSL